MKKFLSAVILVMVLACNNGGECVCGSFPPPDCEPTYDNAYECGTCHGYRWSCDGRRKNPDPVPKKKGMIEADGFDWSTGKKVWESKK